MDSIRLTGIEVWAFHGVLPHEAEFGQLFLVDVELRLELTAAVVDDDLASTVDYGGLAVIVRDAVESPRASLLEVVAERAAAAVLGHDERIAEVEVTVHKPKAPLTVPVADVAVTVTRARSSGSDG